MIIRPAYIFASLQIGTVIKLTHVQAANVKEGT